MTIDKKSIFIAAEAAIIIILVIFLVRHSSVSPEEDPYLQQLKQQNRELENQVNRLKQNYIEIGLADSLQTKNIDSLIATSTSKAEVLRGEAQTYRAALEEMKTREWKRLSDAQKTKEIEEALNFLQNNEKQE